MTKMRSRIKRLLHPSEEAEPKVGITFDLLLLVIFGSWALIPVLFWVFESSNPNLADACGGPGWVDFGCAGDTESTIVKIINLVVWLIVLSIFLLSLARLTNRWENRRAAKK